jgi:hypothetical protein
VATAQERGKDAAGDPGRGDAAAPYGYSGRVARVDPEKRTIELNDTRRGPATSARDKAAGRDTPPDDARGASATMTFQVAAMARVTLDGKVTTFSALRAGQFVRVSTPPPGARVVVPKDPGGGPGEATGKKTSGTEATRTADRIDAFTRDPGPGGTGRDR